MGEGLSPRFPFYAFGGSTPTPFWGSPLFWNTPSPLAHHPPPPPPELQWSLTPERLHLDPVLATVLSWMNFYGFLAYVIFIIL